VLASHKKIRTLLSSQEEVQKMQLEEEVYSSLAECGYRGRIVSIHHLHELQEEIEGRKMQGQFDKGYFQDCLAWFDFQIPDSLKKAKSIIVVAVPRPQTQVSFTFNGETKAITLPPTYLGYDGIRKKAEALISNILSKKGYRIESTKIPLKLLAVRSGLGSYGRNNVCYVQGMGSFLELVAVYTDMPCHKDSWRETKMMESCKNCFACQKNCPTGAITTDRFLLHAERCLVFHNEKKGDIPFPDWIDPSWHNCIIGCLHCQRICPQNKDLLQWFEGNVEFSQKETTLLLKGVPREQLHAETAKKLQHLNLLDNIGILPRNLGVFFKKIEN
jgi:epoxyqueuosine reductase